MLDVVRDECGRRLHATADANSELLRQTVCRVDEVVEVAADLAVDEAGCQLLDGLPDRDRADVVRLSWLGESKESPRRDCRPYERVEVVVGNVVDELEDSLRQDVALLDDVGEDVVWDPRVAGRSAGAERLDDGLVSEVLHRDDDLRQVNVVHFRNGVAVGGLLGLELGYHLVRAGHRASFCVDRPPGAERVAGTEFAVGSLDRVRVDASGGAR